MQRLRPLESGEVTIEDGFWAAFQRRNGRRTIPHIERMLHAAGSVQNFLPPGERAAPERRGFPFCDSDVHKTIEAMAWELGRTGDAALRERIERLVAVVARALEDDGYLNTYWGAYEGRERYSDLQTGHELYCAGHLVQAAVADHVCGELGPGGPRPGICGHPEIEPALAELHRVTGDARHLETARALVDRRGHGLLGDGPFGPAYYQDDVPVRAAAVMRGHAVRALYLLAGAADVAVEAGDAVLLEAVERQWRATIARRTYVTGGMGARHRDEAFGDGFELPPEDAYAETCAGVAAVMLAWKLLLATGDVRYADQIERTLFNLVALPVGVRWTAADPRVEATRGCAVAERGPLVYCAESLAAEDLGAVVVDPRSCAEVDVDGLEGVPGVAAAGERGARLTLIPYHAWANRGPSTMRVWLPVRRNTAPRGTSWNT
jgi:DUF1680 family protein